MSKAVLEPRPLAYPMPVAVLGVAGEKVSFTTVAYCGIVNHNPPMVYVSLNSRHYSTAVIKDSGHFSLNYLDAAWVREIDRCGVVSGWKTDKSGFFPYTEGCCGSPIIETAALSLECSLEKTLDLSPTGVTFIGLIRKLYVEQGMAVAPGGAPDLSAFTPLSLDNADDSYWARGEKLGPAYKIGKELLP